MTRRKNSLEQVRSQFARTITAQTVPGSSALPRAFTVVRREDFLGSGPWQVVGSDGYESLPSDDPALVYQDVVIALLAERDLNNGLPSLHARCLAAANIQPGETVLHIGCGTGYYTAILAELVGPSGTVQALEIDRELARRASSNLEDRPNVVVEHRSGASEPLPRSDFIYVNAAATEPLPAWLGALGSGGRLVFPLAHRSGSGGMLLIERQTTGFAASFIIRASFIPCLGAQDDAAGRRLQRAFADESWKQVRSMVRGSGPRDATCWYATDSWWLSTRPIT